MKKNLVIINNEKCAMIGNKFFCENIEISTLTKSLSFFFNVSLFARSAKINPVHRIFLKEIYTYKNFFSFFSIIKKKSNENSIFLVISITPYTFIAYLFLFFFSNRIFLYLRSHGDQEFRYILGPYSIFLYKICLFIISLRAKLICVNNKIIFNKFFYLVSPSQLNRRWFLKRKKIINTKKINLLYFGRIKKEKGIYSLINIYKNINLELKSCLNIVGTGDNIYLQSPTIKFKKPISKVSKIINLYDNNQILILPSFTEGHPQVMLEALARLKPVIIFSEIKHVKKNYHGVFISKRNSYNLKKTIIYIVKNYKYIQSKIKLNRLPVHSDFIKQLVKILNI